MLILETKSYQLSQDIEEDLKEWANAHPQIIVMSEQNHLTYEVPGAMPGFHSATIKIQLFSKRSTYG